MDQKYIDLYDEYTHTPLDRRAFLKRLAVLAGSSVAASALLPLLDVNNAAAAIIAPGDERLETGYVTYAGASGEMTAYMAHPAGLEPQGSAQPAAIIIIHENRGLNAHIEDVARRAALAGFIAFAPNALSPFGGTPDDTDEARTMIRALDYDKTVQDFVASVSFAAKHPLSNGRVGSVGFCWGGGMSGQLAVQAEDLDGAVMFYGRPPSSEDVAKISAVPLLLNYASLDSRLNGLLPDFETALKAHDIRYTLHMYEGANHAFHNDTAPTRYNEEAATLAWQRTLDFFKAEL